MLCYAKGTFAMQLHVASAFIHSFIHPSMHVKSDILTSNQPTGIKQKKKKILKTLSQSV